MVRAYLGLGSNLGNRSRNIYAALRRLQEGIQLDRISSLYETQPVGYADQPWFLNLVCSGETNLSPEGLLQVAKRIERQMGRKESVRFGPRIIDIDILLYADLIVDTDRLEIPHPRLSERGFVLAPLNEIAPNLPHPALGSTIGELLDSATSLEEVRLYAVRGEQASD
jgi:2-amino-4-hydroxy-6-hydroxymethyldihydropteridine diphosphokinase